MKTSLRIIDRQEDDIRALGECFGRIPPPSDRQTLPEHPPAVPEVYIWLRRSRDNYNSYTDKRRQYMTELLNDILSFGFSI